MTDDQAPWLNNFSLGGLKVVDRWYNGRPDCFRGTKIKRTHDPAYCGWCVKQYHNKLAGKKFKDESECPAPERLKTYREKPLCPASERWELTDVILGGGRRQRIPTQYRHQGYFATKEEAEAAKRRLIDRRSLIDGEY